SSSQPAASSGARTTRRSRRVSVLHRSKNSAARRRIPRAELADAVAVSRAAFSGFPLALSLSTAVGCDCWSVHARWPSAVLHIVGAWLADPRPDVESPLCTDEPDTEGRP